MSIRLGVSTGVRINVYELLKNTLFSGKVRKHGEFDASFTDEKTAKLAANYLQQTYTNLQIFTDGNIAFGYFRNSVSLLTTVNEEK